MDSMKPLTPGNSSEPISSNMKNENRLINQLDERLKNLAGTLLKSLAGNANLSDDEFMKLACSWSLIDSEIIALDQGKDSMEKDEFSSTIKKVSEKMEQFSYSLEVAENSTKIAEKTEEIESPFMGITESDEELYGRNHLIARLDPGEKRWLQSGHIDAEMKRLEEGDPEFKAFSAAGSDHDNPLYDGILKANLEALEAVNGLKSDLLGGKDTKKIAFPINLGRGHWVMAMADTDKHTISYYNSYESKIDSRVRSRLEQLQHFMEKRQSILEGQNFHWSIVSCEGEKQTDGWSCGDHSIWFVDNSLKNEGDKKEVYNVSDARKKLRDYITNNYEISDTGTLMKKSSR